MIDSHIRLYYIAQQAVAILGNNRSLAIPVRKSIIRPNAERREAQIGNFVTGPVYVNRLIARAAWSGNRQALGGVKFLSVFYVCCQCAPLWHYEGSVAIIAAMTMDDIISITPQAANRNCLSAVTGSAEGISGSRLGREAEGVGPGVGVLDVGVGVGGGIESERV